MPPRLWYSETALEQIHEYLKSLQDDFVVIAAGEEIRRELTKLASDPKTPRLAEQPSPFERFSSYQFAIYCGGRKRLAQVSYEFSHGGQQLDILAFSSIRVD